MDRPGLKLSRENAGQENKFRCEKGSKNRFGRRIHKKIHRKVKEVPLMSLMMQQIINHRKKNMESKRVIFEAS